ncbi:hypothetical protein GQR58_022209 [Nymphon striatum]|nr:hypothetical protein GQR58_022209 [Nymphon striatum]
MSVYHNFQHLTDYKVETIPDLQQLALKWIVFDASFTQSSPNSHIVSSIASFSLLEFSEVLSLHIIVGLFLGKNRVLEVLLAAWPDHELTIYEYYMNIPEYDPSCCSDPCKKKVQSTIDSLCFSFIRLAAHGRLENLKKLDVSQIEYVSILFYFQTSTKFYVMVSHDFNYSKYNFIYNVIQRSNFLKQLVGMRWYLCSGHTPSFIPKYIDEWSSLCHIKSLAFEFCKDADTKMLQYLPSPLESFIAYGTDITIQNLLTLSSSIHSKSIKHLDLRFFVKYSNDYFNALMDMILVMKNNLQTLAIVDAIHFQTSEFQRLIHTVLKVKHLRLFQLSYRFDNDEIIEELAHHPELRTLVISHNLLDFKDKAASFQSRINQIRMKNKLSAMFIMITY